MTDWQDDWINASEAEFLVMDRRFHAQQLSIQSEAIKAGASSSSRTVMALYQSLDDEIATRAKYVSDQFKEALASMVGVSASTYAQADYRAEQLMQKTYVQLSKRLRDSKHNAQFGRENFEANSKRALDSCVDQMKIHIRRAGAAAVKQEGEKANYTNVTIHGHGNVVQAGIHKSTVGLTFSSTTVKSLSLAFGDLVHAIEQSDAPDEVKGELLELASECKAEIEKPSPNRMKFTGLLSGLATGVQTLGSLSDAWKSFKAIAATVGIELP